MKHLPIYSILVFGFFAFLGHEAQAQRVCRPQNPYAYGNPNVQYYGDAYRGRNVTQRAHRVRFRRQSYFYSEGLFYQDFRRGFRVVEPPIGITIYRKPFRSRKVRYRGDTYFQSGRYWFVKRRGNYTLVRNPFR